MRAIETTARFFAILCGWGCFILSALIGVDVVARKFFGFSLQGTDELGGYVVAITAAFGFSLALIQRSHTRIDVFLVHVPPMGLALLNVLAMACTAVFAGFMAWRTWATLDESLEFGSLASTPWQTPLWIPQSIWVAGLVMFAVIATAFAVHAAVLLFADPDRLNHRYGPPSLKEEISAELETGVLAPGETKETPR
ncbi:TRAP transporter small permease subunit [Shumkonia mesophila]|uniref:TRAP transporter small permease subunit n=1 Tax=Shumkonia mesophila TaxID=2838854 RepID=UPI00293428F3|nr:TRAP transporter small permease [Shumkonia mesophila]